MKLTPFATAALFSAACATRVADDYGMFGYEPRSMISGFYDDDVPYVSSTSRYKTRS